MQIFSWKEITEFINKDDVPTTFTKGTGFSIGSFDGLHVGHRKLLASLTDYCSKNSFTSCVITFLRPLPSYKHSEDYTGDVSTLSQRLALFEEAGIDAAIVVDFNQEFAAMEGVNFLNLLYKKLCMKFIAEGIDFRCGYKGATDTTAIKYFCRQNNVECSFLDAVIYQEERVSSSYIRLMIKKGFLTTVHQLLCRPYSLDLSDKKLVFAGKNLEIPAAEFVQVFPPLISYAVKINTPAGSFEGRIKIEEDSVKLYDLETGAQGSLIKSIVFDNV